MAQEQGEQQPQQLTHQQITTQPRLNAGALLLESVMSPYQFQPGKNRSRPMIHHHCETCGIEFYGSPKQVNCNGCRSDNASKKQRRPNSTAGIWKTQPPPEPPKPSPRLTIDELRQRTAAARADREKRAARFHLRDQ